MCFLKSITHIIDLCYPPCNVHLQALNWQIIGNRLLCGPTESLWHKFSIENKPGPLCPEMYPGQRHSVPEVTASHYLSTAGFL